MFSYIYNWKYIACKNESADRIQSNFELQMAALNISI